MKNKILLISTDGIILETKDDITNFYPNLLYLSIIRFNNKMKWFTKHMSLLSKVDPEFTLYNSYCSLLNVKSSDYTVLKEFMKLEDKKGVVDILRLQRDSMYGVFYEKI